MSIYVQETVKVENKALPSGFMLINQKDFDEAVHKLWIPAPAKRIKVVEPDPVAVEKVDDEPEAKAPVRKPITRKTRKSR